MPIYDYKCPACERKEEDVFVHSRNDRVKCKQCHANMSRLFPLKTRLFAHVFPQEGIFLEHVSAKGKTFHSTKEMKEYARQNDLELGALL
jgi:putative FmdB family regulatory protein